MALIVMVVYDTIENDRTKYTNKAVQSVINSVDLGRHRIIIVDNGSCDSTKELLKGWKDYSDFIGYNLSVITLPNNIGTAEGWNTACRLRKPGEHVIKIDNDIVINDCHTWVDQMEEVVTISPEIGQVGLKRKDCIESTTQTNPFYKSTLRQMAHVSGERWVIVESQFHIMGSCVLHSSRLLDSIGYMFQIGLYGFDDSFMSARARASGFDTVMLPHIDIDHIDNGDNPYTAHKQKLANDVWAAGKYQEQLKKYAQKQELYYNPYEQAV